MLDILQKVFYRSNPAREAFVEMCKSDYVQRMTFDSYLYKTGEGGEGVEPWCSVGGGLGATHQPCQRGVYRAGGGTGQCRGLRGRDCRVWDAKVCL